MFRKLLADKRKIFLFSFSLLFGFLLLSLLRQTFTQHLFIPASALEDYRVAIAGETEEMANLQSQVDLSEQKLIAYTNAQRGSQALIGELSANLQEELDFYLMKSGAVELQGPGIEIVVDDGTRDLEFGESPNDILVHDSDILLILNELKAAGAEAISINGQRVVNCSSISCSGYTIRVNGQFFARPFVIEAIGDGARMSARLIGPAGFGTVLQEWGLVFKLNLKDRITVAKYEEPRFFQYMKPVLALSAKEE